MPQIMPDIGLDPAALSRPSISLSTPILSNKSITVSGPPLQKAPKTSQLIPARIDLEPIYASLKSALGTEQWAVYKEAITQFLIGACLRRLCIVPFDLVLLTAIDRTS
jgi:transcriptional coactivator HFI1/ADA1